MNPDFTPIAAFKDQFGKEFNEAYAWSQEDIINFLKNVSADPGKYNAPDGRRADFKLLYEKIDGLKRTTGTLFTQYTPYQQLLRTAAGLAPIDPIEWINDQKERFFIIYDLLGIFLSLMGAPTSKGLTAKNYSLPLLALYGKWCLQLAKGATDWAPGTGQITWVISADGKFCPFLGASTKGFNPKGGDVNRQWKLNAQRTRWTYLEKILGPSEWPTFDDSPLRSPEKDGETGTRFGNCAETYPCLYILAAHKYKVNDIYGIALKIRRREDYKGEDIWKNEDGALMPPCENCQELLKLYGVDDDKNFKTFPIPIPKVE